MTYKKHTKYLFIILLCFCFIGFAQLSKTHYIPPLTSSPFGNANPEDQYIYISTPNTTDLAFTIKPVGQPASSYIYGNVSNTNPQEIFIGNGNGQLFISSNQTSTIVSNKGYIIEAEGSIYVSVRMNAGGGAQAGALVSKGLSALGTTFRAGAYTNENPQDNYLSFVSVMASEDNTQVNFSQLPTGLIIENYIGPTPISVKLNKGESYTIAAISSYSIVNRDGLIGCLINSDRPIVVNCGSTNGSFHNGNSRDYGIDQIVGLDKVGREYVFVKGDGQNGWENILIVGHTSNTSISINGAGPVATINGGEYYLIEGNQYNSNGNMYVETSNDVFAYQGIGATNSEANQGMFFVPPLSCEARGNLDNIASIERIGFTTYTGGVSIVTKAGANVTINNMPLTNYSAIGPSNVDGNPDYVTYKVTGLFGNISVQSTDELYCAYFNYNGVATSGSYYSGFPSAPEINFDVQFATLGNCIPNITLEAANTENFDNYEWWFDDGSGFQIVSSNVHSITPSLPGKYKLIGQITCTGEQLESTEVPVSICPDDIDNDGIIDNLDVDNDNDGILNCIESKGDVILDIQNINNPQLVFKDGTIDNSIATTSYVTSNTNNIFTTNNLGDFTSSIVAGTNEENNYNISFTEPVNIKFEGDSSTEHNIVDGEYFIVRVFPVDKNITLVDPDNRLLIDSNFDGIFETGITQISGSEIHFKINPNPTGYFENYTFYANQVDGFSFIHKLTNTVNNVTFNGNVSLTCFKNDNDNDGVKDELDLDSDNDGIPDNIEMFGNYISPINPVGVTPLGFPRKYIMDSFYIYPDYDLIGDNDNDGTYNVYDLDSDNDGIFDLEESGSTLLDVNFDGIIDNVNALIGTNGLADTAESLPDSGEMGYNLADTDGDSSFNYIDLDSDGDGCSDVIEAGFSDGNNDSLLGDNTVTTNKNGLVNNANDGYTLPNPDYLLIAPITINTQPLNTMVCETSSTTVFVVSSEAELYQWEVSTDGINWNTITDNSNYTGSQTLDLTIMNVPLSFDDYHYRVKLDRSGNSCGIYSDEVVLTVNPLPLANSPSTYAQCDDDSNDGQAFFNLTLDWIKEEVNSNHASEGLVFSYYKDQIEADSASNPIPDPTSYQDALGFSPETVWIRAEDPNGCFKIVPLTLVVNPYIGALDSYLPSPIFQCDDGNDNRDGISTFNMTAIKDHISNTIFSTINVSVHFFENQIDAETELNEILDVSNHQNINSPNSQSIWVRIKSELGNDCLGLHEFTDLLVVEPLPKANPVTIDRQCDDGTDGSGINDGLYYFDTSMVESTVLGSQDPTIVSLSYWDTNGNPLKDANGNNVVSPLSNSLLMAPQTITIRVTNNVSYDPDGPCYDETTLVLTIDEQPIINDITPQIVCDGSKDDIDNDGIFGFDTSTFDSILRGTQTGMDIYYDYIDENGTPVSNSSTLPNPLISGDQTITVRAINPNNPNCIAATTIELKVNALPDFLIVEEEIVCTSDPTFTVNLDPIIANPLDFDYEWKFEDGTILSSTKALDVSVPGNYTITISNKTTFCSRSKTISVKASEMATITQNDITIKDISQHNNVTINNPDNLGTGTYQFSLESNDGEIFFPYQDSPVFDNVRAGTYTLYVKDDICGIAELEIYVVGHKKFFTPNGDGRNDYWQILGLSPLQAGSTILIFDRYGKLIKQLDPLSDGWDGTQKGVLMPSDDYWFRIKLADGRSFMGHFALKR